VDAYTRLLRHLPADMGVAIVIVNHLRTVATLLHEILPRYMTMPVELITEKLLIQPNRVFVIPEQCDLHVLAGEFRLEPISKPRRWPDVITVFLRSLATGPIRLSAGAVPFCWGDKTRLRWRAERIQHRAFGEVEVRQPKDPPGHSLPDRFLHYCGPPAAEPC